MLEIEQLILVSEVVCETGGPFCVDVFGKIPLMAVQQDVHFIVLQQLDQILLDADQTIWEMFQSRFFRAHVPERMVPEGIRHLGLLTRQ